MERGGDVIAEFADVTRLETPELAGDHGGGDLAAGEDGDVAVLGFGAALGVVCEGDYGVGGVESYAYKVDL